MCVSLYDVCVCVCVIIAIVGVVIVVAIKLVIFSCYGVFVHVYDGVVGGVVFVFVCVESARGARGGGQGHHFIE